MFSLIFLCWYACFHLQIPFACKALGIYIFNLCDQRPKKCLFKRIHRKLVIPNVVLNDYNICLPHYTLGYSIIKQIAEFSLQSLHKMLLQDHLPPFTPPRSFSAILPYWKVGVPFLLLLGVVALCTLVLIIMIYLLVAIWLMHRSRPELYQNYV